MQFEKLQNEDKEYLCDNCEKSFKAREMKLLDPSSNVKIAIAPSPFIYVDKDGKIMGGREQPSKEKGDKVAACPHCDFVHLFGFDLAK